MAGILGGLRSISTAAQLKGAIPLKRQILQRHSQSLAKQAIGFANFERTMLEHPDGPIAGAQRTFEFADGAATANGPNFPTGSGHVKKDVAVRMRRNEPR